LRKNCPLMHVIEGKIEGKMWGIDDGEDESSYWMTLRKQEDTVNWKRKHYIALCGKLALEEPVDL
jgi:hypothetical protein